MDKFSIIVFSILGLVFLVSLVGFLIETIKPLVKKEKEEARKREIDDANKRLEDLSNQYGDRLQVILGAFVRRFGDNYSARDCDGDHYYYKRFKETDEDGVEWDMTESRIHLDGELVFDYNRILKEGSWIEDLLSIEETALKAKAKEDEQERKRKQEEKERAERYARAKKLQKAACYIAENLGEDLSQRFHFEYRYEQGKFTIEFTQADCPKVYYNGICVLYYRHNYQDEFSSDICEIYHAGSSWEKQLLDLEEDAKRKVEERRKKEQKQREEEKRRNHLPLDEL